MRERFDINYVENALDCQKLDILLPEVDGFDTVIHLHGGGLESGKKGVNKYLRAISEKGVAVVSPEYRMYPKYKYPDFMYDAANAVAFVQKHITEWGGNGRIFLYGSSAGSYIASLLSVDDRYYKSAVADPDGITGYICESGCTLAHFNVLKYRGQNPSLEIIDDTAPMHYLSESKKIKPTLMIYYEHDSVRKQAESMLYYASAKGLDNDAPIEHIKLAGWHCKPENADDLVNTVYGFIEKTK